MEGWRNAPRWLDEYAARENWRPDRVAGFAERFAASHGQWTIGVTDAIL